ncbi:hypothetical protein [Burkholderia ambifaria]|uniref:hypothetical protein n=1 Tax=Burkholderia ambifaria TaxID=152480 RepID=UPI002FE2916E
MTRNDPLDASGWQPAAGTRPNGAIAPADAGGNRKALEFRVHPFIATLMGAVVVARCRRLGCPPVVAAVLGGVACVAWRMAAVRFGWQLPKLPRGRRPPTHDPFVAAGTSNTRSNAHWNTNA